MTRITKVGRARPMIGAAVFKKKAPFAQWLDTQKRSELTYDDDLPNPEGIGWSAEDMVYEAAKRGVKGVRCQTIFKRRSAGSVPNSESLHALKRAFPTIRFE
jgi:hypothetical protein